jgi:hypothetical protein
MLNKHSVKEKNKSPTVSKVWLTVKLSRRTNTSNPMTHFSFFLTDLSKWGGGVELRYSMRQKQNIWRFLFNLNRPSHMIYIVSYGRFECTTKWSAFKFGHFVILRHHCTIDHSQQQSCILQLAIWSPQSSHCNYGDQFSACRRRDVRQRPRCAVFRHPGVMAIPDSKMLPVVAQSVSITGWTVLGSNSVKCVIFRTHPEQPWGPLSFLYNEYRVSLLGGKAAGAWN